MWRSDNNETVLQISLEAELIFSNSVLVMLNLVYLDLFVNCSCL